MAVIACGAASCRTLDRGAGNRSETAGNGGNSAGGELGDGPSGGGHVLSAGGGPEGASEAGGYGGATEGSDGGVGASRAGSPASGRGGADGGGETTPLPPLPPEGESVACDESNGEGGAHGALPQDAECRLDGDGSELVIRGDVLAPSAVYVGGELRVATDGTIACVGCDCSAGGDARVLSCPGARISPAFVNPHDHVAYAHQPPPPPTAARYEHRHDWRLGVRGHTAIPYEGGAPPVARAAHELRMLLGAATTIAGGAGHRGLLRNPDMPNLGEGLPTAPADSDTFPLDDSGGLFVTTGCHYGSDHTRQDDVERYGAYLPHLGEGIDSAAHNELTCALTRDFGLIQPWSAVVHAVAADATQAHDLGAAHALVVWSPRSNVSLYGNTAPVPLLRRAGVEIALGTDWLLSGSMNLQRELACARSWAETYWPGALSSRDLWSMVTTGGARAVGAEHALGRLAQGYLADIAVMRGRTEDAYADVVGAGPGDVLLVLRGGTPLYGRAAVVGALGATGCEAIDVCGAAQQVCPADTGLSLETLRNAAESSYPLFSCGPPPNEPDCVPSRPGEYAGTPDERDRDGDGVEDRHDLCPDWFDPARPLDAGAQADTDADGLGDVCDPCPLDADPDCSETHAHDRDADRNSDARDLCPDLASVGNADADADDRGDACDFCASPNPGVTPCALPIRALRDPTDPQHPPRHALVEIEQAEVVALRPDSGSARGFYIQDGIAEFSGLFVYTAGASPGVAPGDWVALRGRYDRYYESDQLVLVSLLSRQPGEPTLSPVLVDSADVTDGGSLARALDSMLVRVDDTSVTDVNPDAPADYDEFALTSGLRVDDLLIPALDNTFPLGTHFASVTGILGQSFEHQKLLPRDDGDLVSSQGAEVAALRKSQ